MKKNKNIFLKIIFFIFMLFACIYIYATTLAPNMTIYKEYKIEIENLPNNFEGFKIVHVSDILYGTNFNEKNLKNLVKKINECNPDIVVISGDLINKKHKITSQEATKISDILNKINTTCGKYIITGDNDYKFDEWQNIVKNSGFINLNNSHDTIYKKGYSYLLIAGASTFEDKENINSKLNKTIEYINSLETNGPIYKILIMHEPDYINDLNPNPFNLILAGHVNSKINIPGYGNIIKKNGATTYYNKFYKLKNSQLFISQGIGTEDYKYRFNISSFNIYRLVNN